MSDLTVAGAYFLAISAALLLARFDGGIALLWIGAAVLIPALIRRRRRDWGTLLLLCGMASTLATGLFGLGWALAVPMAFVNLTEAFVAAHLLRKRRSIRPNLESLGWFRDFILAAGIAGPAIGALLAAIILSFTGLSFGSTLTRYFAGHALGNLTFIPIITLVMSGQLRGEWQTLTRDKVIELAALLVLVAAVSLLTFSRSDLPLLFLPCGPIVLTLFRGRQIGAAASILILTLVGGGMTMAGSGPIHLIDAPIGFRMQFFQFYLASVVLTALPITADLKNRARLHREMRFSEARYRLLADHSSDIIMHLDLDGTIRFASPAIENIAGYQPERLIGTNCTDLLAAEDVEGVRESHAQTLASRGETVSFEYRARLRDGQLRWFETYSRAVLDRDGKVDGVLSVLRDITERKTIESQLREAASTDPLTGLPNRRAFWARAASFAAIGDRRHPHCIALLDIDHFKSVNDRHGHEGGDAVLRQFALQARESLRDIDMIARFGGEEFALLLPDTRIEDALRICERLRGDIAEMGVPTATGMIRVTISGGVAELTEAGLDAAIAIADRALYQAKAGGRDQLVLAA